MLLNSNTFTKARFFYYCLANSLYWHVLAGSHDMFNVCTSSGLNMYALTYLLILLATTFLPNTHEETDQLLWEGLLTYVRGGKLRCMVGNVDAWNRSQVLSSSQQVRSCSQKPLAGAWPLWSCAVSGSDCTRSFNLVKGLIGCKL